MTAEILTDIPRAFEEMVDGKVIAVDGEDCWVIKYKEVAEGKEVFELEVDAMGRKHYWDGVKVYVYLSGRFQLTYTGESERVLMALDEVFGVVAESR